MSPAPQMVPHESWVIHYDCPLRDVPPPLLVELLTKLRGIADDLSTLDEVSGVWNIVRSGQWHLQVKGWLFAYRVPGRGVLSVFGAHPTLASGGMTRRV